MSPWLGVADRGAAAGLDDRSSAVVTVASLLLFRVVGLIVTAICLLSSERAVDFRSGSESAARRVEPKIDGNHYQLL
jgi:hypothetical protein